MLVGATAGTLLLGTGIPRRRKMSSRRRSCPNAARVALATLAAFFEPKDLLKMSRTPADSKTARTVFPAMIPVPGDAGLRSTFAPSKIESTSCGMVGPSRTTCDMACLAFSPPLRIASATSPAFPKPIPTLPFLSPTTTKALKLNRRPPLTTFAERLMNTTFSVSSSPPRPSPPPSPPSPPGRPRRPNRPGPRPGPRPSPVVGLLISATVFSPSKLESTSPCRLGKSLHLAVITSSTPIKHHSRNSTRSSGFGGNAANFLRRSHISPRLVPIRQVLGPS